MVRTRCPHCKGKLEGRERIHEACIAPWADAQAQKAERRAAKASKAAQVEEKRQDRVKKEQQKPRAKWLKECERVVNKYVRLRDRDLGCCSCDKPANWGGQWHASHLRSVGAASAVRFNLWNIAKGCSECNHFLSGNLAEYLPRARERWGNERVDWLFAQNAIMHYDIEYLRRLKRVMSKKVLRLEKRIGRFQ